MKLFWSGPARRELETIFEHIAEDDPQAALNTYDSVSKRVQLLADHPEIGRPGRVEGTREFVLSGTVFIVAYRVTDRVEILAIKHGAQEWPESFC